MRLIVIRGQGQIVNSNRLATSLEKNLALSVYYRNPSVTMECRREEIGRSSDSSATVPSLLSVAPTDGVDGLAESAAVPSISVNDSIWSFLTLWGQLSSFCSHFIVGELSLES